MDTRLAASIGGFTATVPMTAVMLGLSHVLEGERPDRLPPREMTENLADAAGAGEVMDAMGESGRQSASMAAHFTIGATAGMGYIPFAGKSGLPAALEGALYGLAVWGGGYLGVATAMGLYRPATEEPVRRNLMTIAAHVVWGSVLGLVYERLTRGQNE